MAHYHGASPLFASPETQLPTVEDFHRQLFQLNAYQMLHAFHDPDVVAKLEAILLNLVNGIGSPNDLALVAQVRALEHHIIESWQSESHSPFGSLPPESWYCKIARTEIRLLKTWFREHGVPIDCSDYYDYTRFQYILPESLFGKPLWLILPIQGTCGQVSSQL